LRGNHDTPVRPTRDRTRRGYSRVAQRYSGDELDDALKGARRAIGYCFKEARAEANASSALIEAIDAARSIARNRA
jgi:hypothetical protein